MLSVRDFDTKRSKPEGFYQIIRFCLFPKQPESTLYMFISFKQIAAIPFSLRLGNPLKYDEATGSPTHIQFSAFMMGKTPKSNKIKMNSPRRMVITSKCFKNKYRQADNSIIQWKLFKFVF